MIAQRGYGLYMLVRDIAACPHRRVLDNSILCELLHPGRKGDAGAPGCSIAHAIVPAGESTLPHRLKKATELYYILSGTGRMHIGGEEEDVRPGQAVLIPPKAVQHIRNTGAGDLEFLCIVIPAWQEEDEELV